MEKKTKRKDSEKKKKVSVNLLSMSEGFKGQGVHSAFEDMACYLKEADFEVFINSDKKCDIIHAHTVDMPSYRKLKKENAKKVVSGHLVPDSMKGSLLLSWLWLPLFKIYLKKFYNLADVVTAVSPDVKRQLQNMGVKTRIEVLPNSVDLERFRMPKPSEKEQTRKKLGIKSKQFICITSGQLQPRKGPDWFVDLAGRFPDCLFVWAGGRPFGRLTSGYRECNKIVKNAPKNALFLGTIPREAVGEWLKASDVFVFCSSHETFGISLVEGAATGLPVVARKLEVYKEIFGSKIIQEESIKGMADSINQLIENNRFYKAQTLKSLQLAKKYSKSRVRKHLLNIHDSLLHKKSNL